MEQYIRRYFWVLGIVVVAVCAVFAARGVNHYVEAKYLGDSEKAPKLSKVTRKAGKTQASRTKTGQPLVKRNMFCSDCVIEEVTQTATGPVVDSDAPPATSLPLRLVATNISTVEKSSFATILNTSTDDQGAYWLGDDIPGAGEIVRVRGRHVDFKNKAASRVERVSLLAEARPAPAKTNKPVAAVKTSPKSKRQELLAAIDAGVKKTGDNDWEIERSVVDKVLANPTAVGRGARIVPSIKNGEPNGFKLYAIRPSSVYSKIGLMNGDTIHAVNGFDLTTPDKALEVYTKVRESNNLSVTVTRRGKPVTLKYSVK